MKCLLKSNELKTIEGLNTFIHQGNPMFDYHMKHIDLATKYAVLINKKLGNIADRHKVEYVAMVHDIFKERSLNPHKLFVEWRGHKIAQDTNRYVRLNLDVLEEYGLDDYFNTDVQLHALASGIFLHKEFKIRDREILYPVMFHSCPIIPVYETLTRKEKLMVDIMMLSDKLSSNYLRINMRESEVPMDLDLLVFGANGKEFNYTMGLFAARLLGQGKSKEKCSVKATEHYLKRLKESNPLISDDFTIKDLGGATKWPKRKSRVLRML